jgi:hypothetical protein
MRKALSILVFLMVIVICIHNSFAGDPLTIKTNDGLPLSFEDGYPGQIISFKNNLVISNPSFKMQVYIAGEDFTDSTHSGAMCPISNSLSIENFEFRTSLSDEWKPMPLYNKDQPLQNATPLTPILERDSSQKIEVQFRLTYPVPCIGFFNSGKFYIIAKSLENNVMLIYSYNFEDDTAMLQPSASPSIKDFVAKKLVSLNFTWEPVSYTTPVKYYYEFSDSSNFSSLLAYGRVESNNFYTGNLDADRNYYFRVRAVSDYAESKWSDVYVYANIPEGKPVCEMGVYENGYCVYHPETKFVCDNENATYNAETNNCEITKTFQPVCENGEYDIQKDVCIYYPQEYPKECPNYGECLVQLDTLKNDTEIIKGRVNYLEQVFIAINETITNLFKNGENSTPQPSVASTTVASSGGGSSYKTMTTTVVTNVSEQVNEPLNVQNTTTQADGYDDGVNEQIQNLKSENKELRDKVSYLEEFIKMIIDFLKSINIDISQILNIKLDY